MARPDYGRARWYGAHGNNYSNARRGRSQISRVVIHVTQGSWSSAINWFRDGRAGVSAHYTVRSNDGFIGQSVQENDIAYHAGNWTYNKTSIGIEHEGYVSNPAWFTGAMYRSSARLTAHLCDKYNIPIDRNHIVGHNEVPGASHTDPGRHWDWGRYMSLVRKYAGSRSNTYRQIVDNRSQRFRASRNWRGSHYSSQRRGRDYRFAKPVRSWNADRAMFKIKIPSTGVYKIWAWWPADSGYNGRTRFLVRTSNGWVPRLRSQRRNGGRWVGLGKFHMRAGDGWWVRIDRRSKSSGYIIADAVMVKKA
ncbi:N-acetylmuramoyl-L-alanine amidase [Rubrobacter aplysinae]|uniref:N-acetylmuramoyl-L-alanine amidase n=1 Tax=Rubrobacter aplysinae TaxID=909625 RepID=UPI0009FD5082|nr:N-acetylmuramoyl-L-alanine amidase [Rubrobacter aplysinae]